MHLGQRHLEWQLCLCVAGEGLALHEVPSPRCGPVPSTHLGSPIPLGQGRRRWPGLPSRGARGVCCCPGVRLFPRQPLPDEITLLFLAWVTSASSRLLWEDGPSLVALGWGSEGRRRSLGWRRRPCLFGLVGQRRKGALVLLVGYRVYGWGLALKLFAYYGVVELNPFIR